MLPFDKKNNQRDGTSTTYQPFFENHGADIFLAETIVPVFKPWCLKMDSVNAQVEPFPLVPLTCITLRLFNRSLDIPDSSRQSRTC